jgi:Na+:H+ antiporter, NhaA family
VFRHLPLSEVHPNAQLAAEAVEAAGAQGAFWAMHDRLFAHQDELEGPDLLDHAAALGLDLERFARELGDGTYGQRVRDDVAAAEASGVRGTPTFFVNGVRHEAPATTDALAAALLRTDPRGTPAERPVADGAAAPEIRRTAPLSPPARLPAVAGLEETPDEYGASPRLDDRQLGVLRRAGRRRTTASGDVLVQGGSTEWDFVVVLEGTVAVVEEGLPTDATDGDAPEARVVSVVGPGRFLGGLNMLAGQRAVRSVIVAAPGAVLTLSVERLREVMAADRELADLIMRAFLLRRAMLIGRATGLRVVGDPRWPASAELRAVLDERGIAHRRLDPTEDDAARAMVAEIEGPDDHRPVVLAADGRVLVEPTVDELLRAAGTDRVG